MDYSHCQGNRWRRSKRGGCCSTRGARRSLSPGHSPAPAALAHRRCPHSGRGAPRHAPSLLPPEGAANWSQARGEPGEPGLRWVLRARRCGPCPRSPLLFSSESFSLSVSCLICHPFFLFFRLFFLLALLTISPAANVFTSPPRSAPQTVTQIALDAASQGVCVCNRERESVSVGYRTQVEDLPFHEKGHIDVFFWNLRLNGMTYRTFCIEKVPAREQVFWGALACRVVFWGQARLCPPHLLHSKKQLFLREVSVLREIRLRLLSRSLPLHHLCELRKRRVEASRKVSES